MPGEQTAVTGRAGPLRMERLRPRTRLSSAVCVVPRAAYLLCARSSICEMGIIMLIPGTEGAAGELPISGEEYRPEVAGLNPSLAFPWANSPACVLICKMNTLMLTPQRLL